MSQFIRRGALAIALVATASAIGLYWWNRSQLLPTASPSAKSVAVASMDGSIPVRVSQEARKNINLTSAALQPTTYTTTIDIPGIVVDKPGTSDRGVISPVTGIVTKILVYPGSTVAPNAPLFSLRLVSETLHSSQLELFKATKEIDIAKQQKQRLEGLAQSGAVSATRIIELDNQIQRMEVNVEAYRQGLRAFGLADNLIDMAAKGEFVREYTVYAPNDVPETLSDLAHANSAIPFTFEMHSLRVELGQQVAAGEILCNLADHRQLMVEGRAFKRDLPAVQHSAIDRLPVKFAIEESDSGQWPTSDTSLFIQSVANSIDPKTRTFTFYLPLENQWHAYDQAANKRLIWRFRPGDRLRLLVSVAAIENVFVLPQAAVVREGPSAYVFRQNGDLFDRIAVHVMHEDRMNVAIANEGKLRSGMYVAQNSAVSLNRVMKAQLASGQPTNMHVHADGTTHANH